MNATTKALSSFLLASVALVGCAAPGAVREPPGRSQAVMEMVSDYATWRLKPGNEFAPADEYIEGVLLPRALEAAGITQAVDNPEGALQAWASDAVLTPESALVSLALVERVDGLAARYDFDELHRVVAKLLGEVAR